MVEPLAKPQSTWSPRRLGELFKLSSGATKPSDVVEEPDGERSIPVYGGNGILGYSSQSNCSGRNIIIGRVGAYCGCVHLSEGDCWITDNALYTSKKLDKFCTDFLAYLLVLLDLSRLRGQSGQPLITQEPIHSQKILLPPLPEQRRIAEILRTWDEAIEKLEALRAANIRRRTWFRTHLFTGKTRLPGFTGEWRKVPMSEVLHEHGSKSTGAEEVYSVSVHKGLVNQIEHLGRSFSAANTDHYNRVLPGDIVYTKSPTGNFPLGIIKQSKIDREVIVSPLYGIFTAKTYALGVMLDALFESPLAARNYLHPLVQKGAKNTIAVTNSQFLEGKLSLPMDPAEQAAIAEIINVSQAECDAIGAEITALQRQKRGLMQKLLTGEWRVSVEDTAEAAK